MLTAGDEAAYTCDVTDNDGAGDTVTSAAAALKVLAITAQPAPMTASVGTPAAFSITAAGGNTPPYSYQWRHETTDIPGATDSAFNIGSAMIAVQTLPEGVYIVMSGRVFTPHNARKNRELNRFETV